jgi:hypothetical protein
VTIDLRDVCRVAQKPSVDRFNRPEPSVAGLRHSKPATAEVVVAGNLPRTDVEEHDVYKGQDSNAMSDGVVSSWSRALMRDWIATVSLVSISGW